jgi:hypothetical protein
VSEPRVRHYVGVPDPPKIVPISKSTTAHELLGALIGLSLIGVLRAYDASQPGGVVLDSFWESRRELATEAFRVAQHATGLGDETASMFDEFWKPPVHDALLWLDFYAGMRVDRRQVGIPDIERLAVLGLYRQLHELIMAMVRGAGERNPRQKTARRVCDAQRSLVPNSEPRTTLPPLPTGPT